MDWKLELVAVPVSDVDRAKAFYTEQVGFSADHDHRVSDEISDPDGNGWAVQQIPVRG
jgi:catechol 2,3-dioxygenase-like lactoylglutathione lyase family enzyme